MFARLLLLFILLPLADLVLIIMLLRVHWAWTVLWILVSGLAGAWYVRRQGTQVIRQMRQSLDQNRVPTDILVEGFLVVLAGALLITPGLITDLLGFSMLLPPARRWYRKQFVAWLKQKVRVQAVYGGFYASGDVVDATVVKSGKPAEDSAIAVPEKVSPLEQAEWEH